MIVLSAFTSVYEMLIGANPDNPEYREGIFSSVGMLSLVASLVFCFIFYIAIGRWKPVFHKTAHWIITLFTNTIVGFCMAYVLTQKNIGVIDSYALRFAFINALYTALYFSLFSILLKRFSIFAKHSPF